MPKSREDLLRDRQQYEEGIKSAPSPAIAAVYRSTIAAIDKQLEELKQLPTPAAKPLAAAPAGKKCTGPNCRVPARTQKEAPPRRVVHHPAAGRAGGRSTASRPTASVESAAKPLLVAARSGERENTVELSVGDISVAEITVTVSGQPQVVITWPDKQLAVNEARARSRLISALQDLTGSAMARRGRLDEITRYKTYSRAYGYYMAMRHFLQREPHVQDFGRMSRTKARIFEIIQLAAEQPVAS